MSAVIQATVKNVERLRARLAKFNESVRRGVAEAIKYGAVAIQRTAVESIQNADAAGSIYQRGSRTHQASAPGDPPASDTGNLAANILTAVEDRTDGATIAYVYVTDRAPYGKWLEYGTTQIAARPFLRPAFLAHRDDINEAIKAAYHGAKPKG